MGLCVHKQAGHLCLHRRSIFNHLTLRAGGACRLTGEGPRMEIVITFLGRQPCYGALHPHLTLKFTPPKTNRCIWIFGELATFATSVVGEKDQTTVRDSAQQHDACAGVSIGGCRRQRHRGWLHHIGFGCFTDPVSKQLDGVAFKIRFFQYPLRIFRPETDVCVAHLCSLSDQG